MALYTNIGSISYQQRLEQDYDRIMEPGDAFDGQQPYEPVVMVPVGPAQPGIEYPVDNIEPGTIYTAIESQPMPPPVPDANNTAAVEDEKYWWWALGAATAVYAAMGSGSKTDNYLLAAGTALLLLSPKPKRSTQTETVSNFPR